MLTFLFFAFLFSLSFSPSLSLSLYIYIYIFYGRISSLKFKVVSDYLPPSIHSDKVYDGVMEKNKKKIGISLPLESLRKFAGEDQWSLRLREIEDDNPYILRVKAVEGDGGRVIEATHSPVFAAKLRQYVERLQQHTQLTCFDQEHQTRPPFFIYPIFHVVDVCEPPDVFCSGSRSEYKLIDGIRFFLTHEQNYPNVSSQERLWNARRANPDHEREPETFCIILDCTNWHSVGLEFARLLVKKNEIPFFWLVPACVKSVSRRFHTVWSNRTCSFAHAMRGCQDDMQNLYLRYWRVQRIGGSVLDVIRDSLDSRDKEEKLRRKEITRITDKQDHRFTMDQILQLALDITKSWKGEETDLSVKKIFEDEEDEERSEEEMQDLLNFEEALKQVVQWSGVVGHRIDFPMTINNVEQAVGGIFLRNATQKMISSNVFLFNTLACRNTSFYDNESKTYVQSVVKIASGLKKNAITHQVIFSSAHFVRNTKAKS